MVEVFDRGLKKRAALEHVYDREETQRLNGVSSFTFRLPGDDAKAAHMTPFCFVRTDGGAYYRLLADGETVSETGERRYECEHAIATLVDDVMFGTRLLGGLGLRTRDVINYILAQQTVRRWVLDECDFDKQFEYGFESENLLNALFAVPNLFVGPYRWVFDMRAYPWKVSLKRLDVEAGPRFLIHAGRNLIASTAKRSGTSVCTRLYLLGYGEGDNQLTIAGINDGKPYLESPPEVVAKYGLISKVYVDRQFEDAESLMERGRALLSVMQEPQCSRSIDVADLYKITQAEYDRAEVGDIVRLDVDGTTAYITGVRRRLDIDGDMTLELSTRAGDIAADIADIADRQRIEQVYAQGATQIYAQSVQANATTKVPAQLNFFIPREMRIVNKVLAKISLDRFRSYSSVTAGGGRATTTSSGGGGAATTSSVGGESTQTTTAGGETTLSMAQTVTLDSGVGFVTDASSMTVTEAAHPSYSRETGGASGSTGSASAISTGSAAGGSTGVGSGTTGGASASYTAAANGAVGSHAHSIFHTHSVGGHTHAAPAHTHSMSHTHGMNAHIHPIGAHRHHMSHTHSIWHQHKIPAHSHGVPSHSHRVSVPGHSHGVSIPSHTHNVTVPDHTHEITQGIYRYGKPTRAVISVGGVAKLEMAEEMEVDLTEYLVNAGGKIPRGSWIRVGVLPDDLAYVTIDLVVQGFVQSRGGMHA